jgi:hypothetical protein
VIHEPESIRLQKDIERLSHRLEYEKRESNYLDERISMMNHEISQITEKPKTSQSQQSLKSTLSMLEKQLRFDMLQLNEAKANNKKIRSTIDEYRLERLSYKRSLHGLQEDLLSCSELAEMKNLEYRKGGEMDQMQKSKISMLRCKSLAEQSKYSERLSQLQSILNEDRMQRSKVFKIMEQEVKSNINRPIEGVEVSRILKNIIARWSAKTRDKKKNLDTYTKHIKVVEDAFKQIKQATGIPSVEEIVTAFIKSQEQNYQIYSYMNNLNSEIDNLDDYLNRTKEKIRMMESFKESGEKNINDLHGKLENNSRKIDEKMEKKQKEINSLRQNFTVVLKKVGEIFNVVQSLPIQPQLNKKFEKNWLNDLNDENLMNSLGYIEEFVNYMIILLSYSNNSGNAFISHIPINTFEDPGSKELKTFDIQSFIEEKDLFDDKDIEDIKNPLPQQEIISKACQALRAFDRHRNISEDPRNLSFLPNK